MINDFRIWEQDLRSLNASEKLLFCKPADRKLLSSGQEKSIQAMIVDKMPYQLKLDFVLWTRKAVKELVEREFGVVLAINTMGNYVQKWEFTLKSPRREPMEQCPKIKACQ